MIAALYSQGRLCQPIADGGMPPGVPHPVSDLALNLVSTTMNEIGVTWQDPTDGPEFDTIRLQVQSPGGDWTPIQETTVASGVQAGLVGGGALTPNTEYQVRVRTEGLSGNSEWALLDVATRPSAPGLSLADGTAETAAHAIITQFENALSLTPSISTEGGLPSWTTPYSNTPGTWEADLVSASPGLYVAHASVTNTYGLQSADTTGGITVTGE